MFAPAPRIHGVLKASIDRLKYTKESGKKIIIYSIYLDNEISLSLDSKTKKLAKQLIYESIAQMVIGREKKDSKIAEGISHDLFANYGSKGIVWNSQLRFSL